MSKESWADVVPVNDAVCLCLALKLRKFVFEPRNLRTDQLRFVATQDDLMVEVSDRVQVPDVDSLGVPRVTGFLQRFVAPYDDVADVGPVTIGGTWC